VLAAWAVLAAWQEQAVQPGRQEQAVQPGRVAPRAPVAQPVRVAQPAWAA
jgi:hypothetical protein